MSKKKKKPARRFTPTSGLNPRIRDRVLGEYRLQLEGLERAGRIRVFSPAEVRAFAKARGVKAASREALKHAHRRQKFLIP